jgi:hypothetical protein
MPRVAPVMSATFRMICPLRMADTQCPRVSDFAKGFSIAARAGQGRTMFGWNFPQSLRICSALRNDSDGL